MNYLDIKDGFETVVMSFKDWSEMQENPIQRDTERHAAKALKNHLKKDSITHLRVSAAVTETGEMYKLDGHTRTYLWVNGLLSAPKYVYVDMYRVNGLHEVMELYKQFDNKAAAEDSFDKLSGAVNLHGYVLQSHLLKSSGLTTSLQIVSGKQGKNFDTYKAVDMYINEIKIIDKMMLTANILNSGVLAAMILVCKVYGPDSLVFFRKVANDEGIKTLETKDAVQCLREAILKNRKEKKNSGRDNVVSICEKALSAHYKWINGKTIKKHSGLAGFSLSIFKNKHSKILGE